MKHIKLFFSEYKTIPILILVSILILGIVVRFAGIDRQMTHIDDVGVAWSILVQTNQTYTIDYARNKINNVLHEDYNTPQYKLLRKLDKWGKLNLLFPYLKRGLKFIVVPQSFTYAPFQFLFTSLLISSNQDYQSLLFWGRFPSFIFSILALILAFLLFIRIDAKTAFLPAVFSLLFLSFSWENIIYARHMSSYAIGVFAAVLLLYTLVEILDNKKMTIFQGVLTGLILAISSNMQYQILYFIPAFFLVWLFKIIRTEKLNFFSIKPFIGAVVSYGAFILPSLFAFILPQAYLNGKEFIGTSYNFHISSGVNFYEAISYIFNFFSQNGFKTVGFITMFLPQNNVYVGLLTSVISIFVFFGLARMFFSRISLYKYMGWFFAFSALTIIGLMIIEKVSFSPTRHSLIYLPYIIFTASYGIKEFYYFCQKMIKFNLDLLVALVFFGLVAIPFFYFYKETVTERLDPFNEAKISNLARKYKPHYVVATDMNIFFMDTFKNWEQYHAGERLYNTFKNTDKNDFNTYMLISQSALDNNLCGKMLSEIDSKLNYNSGYHQILYQYDFDNNSTLDILSEAHTIYNKFSIKIIKI